MKLEFKTQYGDEIWTLTTIAVYGSTVLENFNEEIVIKEDRFTVLLILK